MLLMPLLLGRTDAKRLLPVLEASLTEALGETHAVAAHMCVLPVTCPMVGQT